MEAHTDIKLLDIVTLPINAKKKYKGTVTYITPCGKYAKVKYWKGEKHITGDFKTEELKK
jgi:hypothetical protein